MKLKNYYLSCFILVFFVLISISSVVAYEPEVISFPSTGSPMFYDWNIQKGLLACFYADVDSSNITIVDNVVIQAKNGTNLKILDSPHADFISAVKWSPDGTMLALASFDGTVSIWDSTTFNKQQTIIINESIIHLDWVTANSNLVVTTTSSNAYLVKINPSNHTEDFITLLSLPETNSFNRPLAWNQNNDSFLIAINNTIYFFNENQNNAYSNISFHNKYIEQISLHPSGKVLVVAFSFDPAIIFNLTTMGETFLDEEFYIHDSAIWNPAGDYLFVSNSLDSLQTILDYTTLTIYVRNSPPMRPFAWIDDETIIGVSKNGFQIWNIYEYYPELEKPTSNAPGLLFTEFFLAIPIITYFIRKNHS